MMPGRPFWAGPCLPRRRCKGAVWWIWGSITGEGIFGDAPARRDHLQLACFEIASTLVPGRHCLGAPLLPYLGQWPLLVHELFLPSLSSHSLPSHKELE